MSAIVELNNVTYQYPLGSKPSIIDFNLKIEEGSFWGVIGPNGAGKTTLCAILRGFIPEYYKGKLEGEVLIHNSPIQSYKEGELSSLIGYVFQNPFNQISGVKDTVFEEIAYGLENLGLQPEEIEDRVVEVMKLTNIEHLALKHPFYLSGGQQQRMALASTLVLNPDILVIDEPTSQLDPEGTESVFKIIEKLKQARRTIILVEHKIDLIAEFADNIVVMKEGRALRSGPKQEVLSDISLEAEGIQLPQYTLLGHALQKRGMKLDYIPITEKQAIEVIGKAVRGGEA
ncbi:MAG: ABC transporter ATP-binding protein [Christensenellales bacterium]|nr:ABC transporter ATP-binding protein [Christensenellales bacterium]